MSDNLFSVIESSGDETHQRRLCHDFVHGTDRPRYILGRNVYANSVASQMAVDGFIDDYAAIDSYLDRPVVRTEQVPAHALVLNAAGGRPFSARRRLEAAGLESIDYFAFLKWSGLPLRDVVFNEGFADEYAANRERYAWAYGRLDDEASRDAFRRLVSFRLFYDLAVLEGFEERQDVQYFEPFLDLRPTGEVFVDVGGYDGFTSREFARRCPGYAGIHIFEPDETNVAACRRGLDGLGSIHLHQVGLSNARRTLRFQSQGSGSRISDGGDIIIEVDRLDDVLTEPVTFIKMDIEGEELNALDGARRTILDSHPRLAISVYHRPGDFWRIPEKILSVRNDYRVLLRSYTESIYETVMFFLPVAR